jgi:hypothetical protein
MLERVFRAAPRKAVLGAAMAGVVGLSGSIAAAQDVPFGVIILILSASGVGASVAGLLGPPSSQRARYERGHERLAGPRTGARLG